MTQMKKLTLLLVAIALVLSLYGCGKKKNSDASNKSETTAKKKDSKTPKKNRLQKNLQSVFLYIILTFIII